MKKIAVLLLLCTCFVLYSADDFKNALPADGVGYVYVDVKTYMKEINTFNGLVDAFSAEEPLGEFLKPLVEKLDEKLKEVETENDIDFSIKESVTFLKTEMCLYVAGPSYMKETGIPAL